MTKIQEVTRPPYKSQYSIYVSEEVLRLAGMKGGDQVIVKAVKTGVIMVQRL